MKNKQTNINKRDWKAIVLKKKTDITKDREQGGKVEEVKEDINYLEWDNINIIVMEETYQDGGYVGTKNQIISSLWLISYKYLIRNQVNIILYKKKHLFRLCKNIIIYSFSKISS